MPFALSFRIRRRVRVLLSVPPCIESIVKWSRTRGIEHKSPHKLRSCKFFYVHSLTETFALQMRSLGTTHTAYPSKRS